MALWIIVIHIMLYSFDDDPPSQSAAGSASLREPLRNKDLNECFGVWSAEEADQFDSALHQMRQVDPADWELPV